MPRAKDKTGNIRHMSMEEYERMEAEDLARLAVQASPRGVATWFWSELQAVRAAYVTACRLPGRTKEEIFDDLVAEFGFRKTVIALKPVVPHAKKLYEKYKQKWER